MNETLPEIVDPSFLDYWHTTLTHDQYHSDKTAVNFSRLQSIEKSELSFFVDRKPKQTAAFNFGTAVHMALLQPEVFKSRFIRMPKFSGEGSVRARNAFKACLAVGSIPLKDDEYETLQGMLNSVMRHTEACNLLKLGRSEETGYFRDPDTGIKCKIRPDFYTEQGVLLDVKTTNGSCEIHEFSKTIWNYKYHFQMAMYCMGFELIEKKKVQFPVYLVIEKNPPFECALYMADEEMLLNGLDRYHRSMATLKRCIETQVWRGYQTCYEKISLPKWALIQSFEREVQEETFVF